MQCVITLLVNGVYKITSFCWSLYLGVAFDLFYQDDTHFGTAVFQGTLPQSVLLMFKYV